MAEGRHGGVRQELATGIARVPLARPLARSIALGASRSDAHCGADIGIKRFCPDNCPGGDTAATVRFRKG